MGAALLELEQVLRSQKEYLTAQEAQLLQVCKSSAIRAFTFGAFLGGSTAWAVTWRLSRVVRVNISGGAAAFLGFWRFGNSLESCVDHILSRDGSRLQRELATIMVKNHYHVPWAKQLLCKRFYMETVYDDTRSGEAMMRWRYRNYFGEKPGNSDHHEYSDDGKRHDHSPTEADIIKKVDTLKPKQVTATPTTMMKSESQQAHIAEDPIGSIFGDIAPPVEEIHHPATPPDSGPRAIHRSHRRSHYRSRRRMRHHHHGEATL